MLTPLQVNEAVLKKVIEWCEHHRNDPVQPADEEADSRKKTTDIEEWDQKFMQVDQEMLFEVILVRLSSLASSHAVHAQKLEANFRHRLRTTSILSLSLTSVVRRSRT